MALHGAHRPPVPVAADPGPELPGARDLAATDFIYPLFVHEGASNEPIGSMPGAHRWSLEGLVEAVGRAWELGIRCVVLFPKVADGLKSEDGAECFNEQA